ncbi:iron-siderophore ABC transporter substrate-binding protein [Streptomyces sp. R302]|uniref:ABC transporter substrate-binding protein n=1 Tax=unclassified Streptomyces TaxID=2593676 RepID=UPI00145C8ED8|nr:MULTISPECIES: iron-siderophore ABC transporter substrate-binding protein [unclassified Streptomyces]NML51073.1 iron-siderophore ABC transporter substrate-binding protein [Streptomyces sp. R301]NML81168.1 iron-siderophore ABC transporter substrate-binding protein [Streptomyces sp. R302]
MFTRNPARRGRIGALLLTAALAAGLSACGGSGTEPKSSDGTAATAEKAAGFPRTVRHDKGSTEIKAKPQRVVALDNSLVEAVVALDGKLVGGIGSYRDQTGFPPYLGDAVKDTKDVGPLDSPNLEAIAALKPDLIVSATVRHEDLYEQLEQIAPTVFVKTTGPLWKDNVTLLGTALGEEEKAKAKLTAYETRAKKVGAAINAKKKNPTVSIVRFVDGPTRIYLPKSFSGIILQDMGLARPENQRDTEKFNLEISEEQIAQADADVVFYSSFSGGEERKAKFLANPLWSRLAAVKNGDVHEVKDEIWMTSVSLQGADVVLDDMAKIFQVDPAE